MPKYYGYEFGQKIRPLTWFKSRQKSRFVHDIFGASCMEENGNLECGRINYTNSIYLDFRKNCDLISGLVSNE